MPNAFLNLNGSFAELTQMLLAYEIISKIF